MSFVRYRQFTPPGAYTGLSTVGYALYNGDGTLNTARTTIGVTERGSLTGIYGALVTFPAGFIGEIRWDTGTSPNKTGSETVNPGDDEYIDAAMSTRSTYAGADTSGTTTLLTRIPGTVSAQTGDAYARLGANGAGLTALGDTRIANLDAAVSSRSMYAGGAVASVTAGVTLASSEHTLISGTDVPAALTAQGYTTARAGYLDVLNGIVAAIWANTTRTLSAIADSSGVTTLLSRITGALPLATDYTTARAAKLDNLDAAVSSRNAVPPDNTTIGLIYGVVDTEVSAIKVQTDKLPSDPASASAIATAFAAVPAAVLNATVDGSITVKQQMELALSVITGKYASVRDINTKTVTTTYKKADTSTTLAVSVATFADSNLSQPLSRTWTFSNL